jgi:hypothetical protein
MRLRSVLMRAFQSRLIEVFCVAWPLAFQDSEAVVFRASSSGYVGQP